MLYYLQQYLGRYVSGLDPASLRISVLAGDVVLRNLQLKPEALSKLSLPITVKAGLLGSLTLKVPLLHGAAQHLRLPTWLTPGAGMRNLCQTQDHSLLQ